MKRTMNMVSVQWEEMAVTPSGRMIPILVLAWDYEACEGFAWCMEPGKRSCERRVYRDRQVLRLGEVIVNAR